MVIRRYRERLRFSEVVFKFLYHKAPCWKRANGHIASALLLHVPWTPHMPCLCQYVIAPQGWVTWGVMTVKHILLWPSLWIPIWKIGAEWCDCFQRRGWSGWLLCCHAIYRCWNVWQITVTIFSFNLTQFENNCHNSHSSLKDENNRLPADTHIHNCEPCRRGTESAKQHS